MDTTISPTPGLHSCSCTIKKCDKKERKEGNVHVGNRLSYSRKDWSISETVLATSTESAGFPARAERTAGRPRRLCPVLHRICATKGRAVRHALFLRTFASERKADSPASRLTYLLAD